MFLRPGASFPDFDLPGSDGGHYSRSSFLEHAPATLFVIFKTDCPTSQFSLPYLNRLVDQIPRFSFVGVSQDDPRSTVEFLQQWGTRCTHILYEEEPYPLSDLLGVTNVPSLFLVAGSSEILASDFGYRQTFWEQVAQEAARQFSVAIGPIVPPDAPPWAAG